MKPTHKTTLLLTALLVALGLNSCNLNSDPDNGAVMFYADIVSSHLQPDSTLYFEQILTNDRGSVMLYPSPAIKAPISEGARTFIQYSILSKESEEAMTIALYQVSTIRHDTIVATSPDTIEAYPNHPLQLNTLWRTGNYLNLDFSIEFYITPHRMELFYSPTQASSDTLDVILRHDNNGDAVGYWTQTFASFYIPDFNKYKALRLYANMENSANDHVVIAIQE